MYMVHVQSVCALTDRLGRDPIAMYVGDTFQKPYPFQPDAIVDIGAVYEQKLESIGCHESQFYEWLPFVEWGIDVADVPKDPAGRLGFLRQQWDGRFRRDAERFRDELVAVYG